MIAGMLIYQAATGTPKSFAARLTTTTSPLTNRTVIFFDFSKLDYFMFKTSMFVSLSIPSLICFTIVVMGTVFFIINFKQSRKLRNTMSGSGEKTDKMSDKDARLIRLVIFICIIYIVGAAPNVGLYAVQTVYPSLNISNPYQGYFIHALYIVSNLFQATACSVNIFAYFVMGSKFKQILQQTFLCWTICRIKQWAAYTYIYRYIHICTASQTNVNKLQLYKYNCFAGVFFFFVFCLFFFVLFGVFFVKAYVYSYLLKK